MFSIPYLEILTSLPGGSITAFVILLVILAVAFDILLTIFLKFLKFLVSKTETTLDDRILKTLSAYLPTVASITSLWISLETFYPDLIILGKLHESDLYIVVMLGVCGLLLSSIANQVLLWYGLEIRPRKKDVKDEEVFPFVRNVVRIAIIVVFAVFVLQRIGFDTTAIITGLGIGGLAVALALQDTLSNFFAGVHILIDKPFREDDYIKTDSSIEGTVSKIGWRTTRLVNLAQNEVILPNSKLINSTIENFSSPHNSSGVIYEVGVDYKEDIDNVEKLVSDALHTVAKRQPLMDEKGIFVRFDSFGEYSLNFKFGYNLRGYVNRWIVLKEVNRELFYVFKKNNVNIPFPVRVLHNQVPDKKR